MLLTYKKEIQCMFGQHLVCLAFFGGSRALFMGSASTFFFFQKKNFKTGSHDTIHIFINYFVTVFSAINGFQIDPPHPIAP